MEEFTFKFRGKTYRLTDKWEETCVNDSKAFQMQQFKYVNKIGDYVTMKNRINNQIMLGYLEEISYIK
jgi:hypothetical protein